MSFDSLHMAASALRSQNVAMNVASRNLTGSSEPGYTRQVATFSDEHSAPAGRFSQNIEGLGTRISGVLRVRSELLDTAYRDAASTHQEIQAPESHLAYLEVRLSADPSLSSLLQDLNISLAQLQGDPGNLGLRQSYFRKLGQATAQLRSYDSAVVENQASTRADLGQRVEQANSLLQRLAELNPRIVAAQRDTTGSNQMLDQRDRFLDELSGLMDVQVLTQPAGNVDVLANGSQLLSLNRAEKLTLEPDNSLKNSAGNLVNVSGGSIASLQQYANQELPDLRQQLNQLASSWISQANEVHRRTYGLDGVTGRDLLTGTDASTINLALQDPRQLGHAVAQVTGTNFATTALISDQPLSSQAAALSVPATNSGVMQINGVSVAWNDGQSLQQVLDSLQVAGVRASYRPTTGKVVLERDPTQAGPSDITVTDSSGNLSVVLGLAGQPSLVGGQGDSNGLAALDQRMRSATFGPGADRTLQQSFRDIQSNVGGSLQTRRQSGQSALTALESAQAARSSISGVSSDEELLAVTRMEQAFAAAAKIATVADEMLTTLMQMGR
ncbi:hypothetical protein IV102_34950 [bacterium]|nr:hypothetical protein [bacterium]